MRFIEFHNQDLFTIEKQLYKNGNIIIPKAHCISCDFKLGAGIACEMNKKYHVKDYLYEYFDPWNSCNYFINNGGRCLYIHNDECNVFNLVTKYHYYNKPTYKNLEKALLDMKRNTDYWNIAEVAMPAIGCGLDRLSYNKVSEIIKEIFKYTCLNIYMCLKD